MDYRGRHWGRNLLAGLPLLALEPQKLCATKVMILPYLQEVLKENNGNNKYIWRKYEDIFAGDARTSMLVMTVVVGKLPKL